MVTCPFCEYQNYDGALVCVQCHKLLVHLDPVPRNQTVTFQRPNALPRPSTVPIRGTSALAPDQIDLYIEEIPIPLTLHVEQQVMFGRHTPFSPTAQFVDLVPYGGYKKGISRAHALIERKGDTWTLTDLGSANGTWLDGVQLSAYLPKTLASNSNVRLGQLEMTFFCYVPNADRP